MLHSYVVHMATCHHTRHSTYPCGAPVLHLTLSISHTVTLPNLDHSPCHSLLYPNSIRTCLFVALIRAAILLFSGANRVKVVWAGLSISDGVGHRDTIRLRVTFTCRIGMIRVGVNVSTTVSI